MWNAVISDTDQIGSAFRTGTHLSAVLIEQSEAESLKAADTAVICSAAADTDDKIPAAAGHRIENKLTCTERRSNHRVTFIGGQ